MTTNKTPIRKGTVVRVSLGEDHNLYGQTFVVTRLMNVKAVGMTKVKATNLATGGENYEFPISTVTAITDLDPATIRKMDQAVVDRVKQEEIDRAKRLQEQKDKLAAMVVEAENDAAFWNGGQEIEQTSHLTYDGINLQSRMIGPKYIVKRKGREDEEHQRSYEVTASVRRYDGMATFMIPEEDRPIERTVNWAALGSVSPALARAYAKLIIAAADRAEQVEWQRAPRESDKAGAK